MDEQGEDRSRAWERMGAASGLFAVLLFVVAFLIFLSTDPIGGKTPQLPDIANAQAVPAFVADHVNAIRAQVMLNSIGITFFLWFLGTLWALLRRAEDTPARGSVIAFGGALIGVALTLVALVLIGTSTLTTSVTEGEAVPTLYTAASLSFAFGAAAFTIFFLGVAEVILRMHAMAKWLGYLALLAAALSAFGFITPYYTEGVFNPATGALGFYGHYVAFVVWLFLASGEMSLAQRGRRQAEAQGSPRAAAAGPEGVTS
jgi:hypothetical protein